MNGTVLVSVVIPFFNAAAYLAGAVRSVVAQAQPGTEILLVDDASTDDSAVLATSLARQFPGVRLLRMPTNGGPAAARNLGIRHASGRYVCFLDADDEYAPGFLRQTVLLLDENVTFAGVVTGVELLDCHRPVHPVQQEALIGSLPSNLLMRKVAVDVLGGFPEAAAFRGRSGGEDVQFRTVLAYWFALLWCPEKFLRYRVRRGSHFDYFLDRSRVVDGQLIFTTHTAEEQNGARDAAGRLYHAQAAERVSAFLSLRNRDSLFQAHSNRLLQGVVAFDDFQKKLATVPGRLHPQEGFALYHWAKEEPTRGAVMLWSHDLRALCWLAAGCRAGDREKVTTIQDATTATAIRTDLDRFGLAPWVEVRSGKEVSSGSSRQIPIRLLGFDGTEFGVNRGREIEFWSRHVVRGGSIAFVGIGDSAELTQVYEDFIAHPAWKEVVTVRGVRFVQRRE